MSESLTAGLSKTVRIEVDRDRTIDFMGEDGRVYSTPNLLYDIEIACADLLREHIEEGMDSVGTRVVMDHMGATLMGMWVDITVTISEIEGRAITFEMTAKDPLEQVCRGTHNRFIVDVAKTAERLKAKAAKVSEL